MPPNSATALQNLNDFSTQAKSPSAYLDTYSEKLGIPAAQQNVSGLRTAITNTTNLLNQIPQGVQGRTQNSLVTSAQANRQIQNESAPVASNLAKQTTDLGDATSDYDRLLQQAKDSASLDYTGQQDKYSALKDIYTSLYGQEQDALSKQLEDQKLAESAREFNLTPHGSGGGTAGLDLSSLLNGGAQPSVQDQAYTSVQKFINMSPAAALSDYNATLKSANNGNALDKLKVQLYNQNGIGTSPAAINNAQGNVKTGNITVGNFAPASGGLAVR